MKRNQYQPYIRLGLTAFFVLAAAIILNFMLLRHDYIFAFFAEVARILRPIFIGMVLAFLLLPMHRHIMCFFESLLPRHLTKRSSIKKTLNFIAILLSLCFAALLIYILLAMLLPQLYFSIVGFIQEVPDYIEGIVVWLRTFLEDNPSIQTVLVQYFEDLSVSVEEWLQNEILPNLVTISAALEWIRYQIIPNLTGVVAGVSTIVISTTVLLKDILIAVIVSFYLLVRKEIFAAQSKKIVYSIFSTKYADLIIEETRSAYRIMSGFINGKLLDSLIIGIICFVCCNWFEFPYPTLVATIVGVTNVIPFFGPFIGAVPCSILIFLVEPVKCLYFVLFILVLQQFDGNILGPKILGDSTGLASFWVLFSILLFGGLFGFAGMVLGVPVFAMIYSILRRFVIRGLSRRGLPVDTQLYVGKTPPLYSKENEVEENFET